VTISPTVQVILIAAGCSAAVGVAGIATVRWWPRRSVRGALLGAGLVGVLAVIGGVVGTAQAMFLSGHDFTVVLIVCAVAGPVGVTVALVLHRQVVSDVQVLRSAARSFSPDAHPDAHPVSDRRRPQMAELAEVERELVRTASGLAQARRRERALETSRRELVAWVSHDLRTPLAGLRAMAEALEDGVADDPARYHRQMRSEVDRLARMVDDLFELSRIQSGALTLTLRRVDLQALVADVVSGTQPVALSLGVRLGARVAGATVDADPAGLGRVLTNLVVNAIRHTPSDGTVEVVAAQDHKDVVLSVTDCCGGLAQDDLAKVFEAGWRSEAARTPRPHGGAGLGLAIARGIVEAHHGQIRVHNIAGGCRFEVRLPRLQPTG
jgi:signal transduction histidine kinase